MESFRGATTVGRSLKDIRVRRDLDPAEVAARAKMHKSALSRLEAGKGDPKFSTIDRVLKAMNADLADLNEELKRW